jgi:hypothetical protein
MILNILKKGVENHKAIKLSRKNMLLIMLVMDYQMKLSIKQWIFFLWKEARNLYRVYFAD